MVTALSCRMVFRQTLMPPETEPRIASLPFDPQDAFIAHGSRLIWTAISEAVGQMPKGATFDEAIVPGRAAVELARLATSGDLLVLGARHRGWLRRRAPGSVARACAAGAACHPASSPACQ